VHTGDSYCTAPMLTIDEELQKRLQKYSYDIVEAIQVIGGTNIQYAHDPETGRVVVIEINPRTSRSSALASKATGFPIAYVSSLLAGGLTMDEIPYWRDGTLEKYTPSGDYVVVKFCRWAFEKFKDSVRAQGGDVKSIINIDKLPGAKHSYEVMSQESGYISVMNTELIGTAAVFLGAGRFTKEGNIDPASGVLIHKKTGDFVEKGDGLATLYYNSKENLKQAIDLVAGSYTIKDEPGTAFQLIHEVIQ